MIPEIKTLARLKIDHRVYHCRADHSSTTSPHVKKLLQQTTIYTLLSLSILFSLHFYSNPFTLPASTKCDYTDGDWVPTTTPPLYNGTTCRKTIKPNQNCMSHGRPDTSYLYYQWKPRNCNLPPFHPSTFLTSLKNKHLAFVGDSMARNQVESLICLLSSSYTPQLIYSYPENSNNFKFRRWVFPEHNVTISVYWSPFLVNGIENSRTSSKYYNTLFVDLVDHNWAKDLPKLDMVVLTIGHWYLQQALYYQNGKVLGCRDWRNTLNYTQLQFYQIFRESYKTAFKSIIPAGYETNVTRDGIEVVVTTFMPSHFEGDWDKLGACPKKKPYKTNEVEVQGMSAEMRRIVLEEVEEVNKRLTMVKEEEEGSGIRVTVLDITKLSLLRPDGHPGPYMNPFPFVHGVKENVHNDCLHFCLPGPIDTWNQIMLEMIILRQL